MKLADNYHHGRIDTPEYGAWGSMKARCNNPRHQSFHLYGGRGIKVCDRWNKFQNFLSDMGERPSNKHSIDRINNDGNYEPDNCRWATKQQQDNNKSINPSPGRTRPLKEPTIAGIDVTKTGMHYDLIIMDDLHSDMVG